MKDIYPKIPSAWLTSTLSPDEIRHQSVSIMLKGGQKRQERFEIEDVNSKGEILIRIDYNSSPFPGTVSFASYRVTQQDLDSWIADKNIVIKV